MENTEGTGQPPDSVEIIREAPVDPWCNVLEEYAQVGSLRHLAVLHGLPPRSRVARRQLIAHGGKPQIEGDTEVDWSNLRVDYERLGGIRLVAESYGVGFKAVRNHLAAAGIPIKLRGHVKGQKKSEHWREASARHWNDPMWRDEQRRKWVSRVVRINATNRLSPVSPLEHELHEALKRVRIGFRTQRLILDRYFADILITQAPVVIEADGALHYYTASKRHDAERDTVMEAASYRVFRFTGTQIFADPDKCIETVIAECGLHSEPEPTYDIVGSNPYAIGKVPIGPEWRAMNGARLRKQWADPEWRERQIALMRDGQKRRRERRQAVI